jgi:hypothetical protein
LTGLLIVAPLRSRKRTEAAMGGQKVVRVILLLLGAGGASPGTEKHVEVLFPSQTMPYCYPGLNITVRLSPRPPTDVFWAVRVSDFWDNDGSEVDTPMQVHVWESLKCSSWNRLVARGSVCASIRLEELSSGLYVIHIKALTRDGSLLNHWTTSLSCDGDSDLWLRPYPPSTAFT